MSELGPVASDGDSKLSGGDSRERTMAILEDPANQRRSLAEVLGGASDSHEEGFSAVRAIVEGLPTTHEQARRRAIARVAAEGEFGGFED